MPSCAVFGYTNCSRNTKGTFIKFFRFSKNEEYRQQWINACERKDTFIIKNSYVCSVHFKPEDFELPLRQRLLGYISKTGRILKENAVPCTDSVLDNRSIM